jgi:4-oxalocrotonate tautomerase
MVMRRGRVGTAQVGLCPPYNATALGSIARLPILLPPALAMMRGWNFSGAPRKDRPIASPSGEPLMPFVNIRLVRDKIADDPAGKKQRIAAAVTNAIKAETGLADKDVWVVFEEVTSADWHIGPKTVATVWKEAKGS